MHHASFLPVAVEPEELLVQTSVAAVEGEAVRIDFVVGTAVVEEPLAVVVVVGTAVAEEPLAVVVVVGTAVAAVVACLQMTAVTCE